MGKEETLGGERGRSLAAPVIFLIVTAFHSTSWWLQRLNKRASKSATEFQLHAEIKQLLKEANSLSQPSTFAQAAKLRRLAAAKEKELANCKAIDCAIINVPLEIVTYFLLVCWFWRTPVAAISKQLVQPFGKILCWGGEGHSKDKILVGIIPWLILSTRVSKLVSRVFQ